MTDLIQAMNRVQAMTPVNDESIKSLYTPDTFFDDWSPCVTVAWPKIYNAAKQQLNPDWTHLDNGQKYVFTIPDKAIHGALFLDQGAAYFRDYHKGRLSQLRIRYSPAATGTAILGAFWVPYQQRIILHDAYMEQGLSICESLFSDRWLALARIAAAIENDKGLCGYTFEVASHLREEGAKGASHAGGTFGARGPVNEGFSLILQPNLGLATVIHSIPAEAIAASTPTKVSSGVVAAAQEDTKYILRKHSKYTGPEAFQIFKGEDDLGMPCIQSLSLIRTINEKLTNTPEIAVKAQWNTHLKAYEVLAIITP